MVSVALEVLPVGTKPLAAVGERISKDGRHDLGAASPLSTTTSSLQGRAGGSAFTPKLVEIFGPGSTRWAEKLSPRIACTAVAAPSVRSRIFVVAGPSASMARRGCRASCSRRAASCSKSLVISSWNLSKCFYCYFKRLFISRYSSANTGLPDPNSSLGGRGHCPRRQSRSPSVAC